MGAKVHRPDVDRVLYRLTGFSPPIRRSNDLPDGVVCLYLGSPRLFEEFELKLICDSSNILNSLSEDLNTSFRVKSGAGTPLTSVIRYGGAPQFMLDVVAWQCHRRNIPIKLERVWGEDELDIHVFVQNPKRRGSQFRRNLSISIWVDDDEAVQHGRELIRILRAGGYEQISLNISRYVDQVSTSRLEQHFTYVVRGGELNLEEERRLIDLLDVGVQQSGVDVEEHPLIRSKGSQSPHLQSLETLGDSSMDQAGPQAKLSVEVWLPLCAALSGTLRPRGGKRPARWQVHVSVDHTELESNLIERLKQRGFILTDASPFPRNTSDWGGISIEWGSAILYPSIQSAVRGLLLEATSSFGTVPVWLEKPSIEEKIKPSLEDKQRLDLIQISVCSSDFKQEIWKDKLSLLTQRHSLVILCDEVFPDQLLSLKELPWRTFEIDTYSGAYVGDGYEENSQEWSTYDEEEWEGGDEDVSSVRDWLMDSLHDGDSPMVSNSFVITYGSAPELLVKWLAQLIEDQFDLSCHLIHGLSYDDDEIILELPSSDQLIAPSPLSLKWEITRSTQNSKECDD